MTYADMAGHALRLAVLAWCVWKIREIDRRNKK
jgi:hypothetical protein